MQNFDKNVNFGNFQNNCEIIKKFVYLLLHTNTRFMYCFIHFSSHLTKLQTLQVLKFKEYGASGAYRV